jgi:hypothetical protein
MITEKEHIHILKIRRSGEKQLFQIKLPKNAKKITGIHVSIQPSNNPIPKASVANGTQLFNLEQIIF